MAVSQVGDDDLDDGAQVVHEVQDEAKLQGSERLGGSMMTDVLVKYMIWTEQVDNTACSVRVYCKDN